MLEEPQKEDMIRFQEEANPIQPEDNRQLEAVR
jgi:hypothetical protein